MLLKKFLNIFALFIFTSTTLFRDIEFVAAQGIDLPTLDSSLITFTQLGEDEFWLTGPIDAERITFGVPASWRLTGGAEIQLSLTVSSSSERVGTSAESFRGGGSIRVIFNDVLLGIIYLTEVGEVVANFPIPAEALQPSRTDGLMELDLELNSGVCELEENTIVVVHPYSMINLPYVTVTSDTNLINFPRPIYSESFIPETAVFVIPDSPTALELQSALTTSAGFGILTNSDFDISLTTIKNLTTEQLNSSHLILIGKIQSFASLVGQLNTQSLIVNNQYKIDGLEADDGVVHMVNSAWSSSRSILLVSGNTDVGVLKAAQAITTGVLRSGQYPNVAVVKNVQPILSSELTSEDITLGDLGYTTETMDSQGSTSFSYNFDMPPGKVLGSDAFFELAYGHSGLLNYSESAIVINLNGQPIGSPVLNEETSTQVINRYKINIPSSLIQTGKNVISVVINVVPFDICISQQITSEWITVWSDSLLHLPLSDVSVTSPNTISDLSIYPSPFINTPTLSNTAFVLAENDLPSWQGAFNIARYLGSVANGPLSLLKTFYSNEIPESEYPLYNFIVVGKPSDSDFIKLINEDLPAPFDANSNIAIEKNMAVNFLVPPNVPIGYIELLQSPWEHNNIILAVVGNSPEGITWASAPLEDSRLRSQLSGNFAIVEAQRVISTDTRLTPLSMIQQTPIPGTIAAPTAVASNPNVPAPVENNYAWIPTLLSVFGILTLIVITIAVYPLWNNNRTRKIK